MRISDWSSDVCSSDLNTIIGLGDGGAHYGMICDAGYPTFMLTYWARDRADGERIPIEKVISWLTHEPAATLELSDRGRIAVGYKADINLIDHRSEERRVGKACVSTCRSRWSQSN